MSLPPQSVAVNVTQFQPIRRVGRILRRPTHTFNVRHKPWSIQPFMIAPVLPGETLKGLRMKSRAVTDPIREPLVGWWLEHYFFYIPVRDLHLKEAFERMVLQGVDMATDNTPEAVPESGHSAQQVITTGMNAANHHATYRAGQAGEVAFTDACLRRVTEEFFRNEGERFDQFAIGGLPSAGVNITNALESILLDSAVGSPDLDHFDDVNDPLIESEHLAAFNRMKAMKMIGRNITFEDFLKTYGVGIPAGDRPMNADVVGGGSIVNGPELIRYMRDYQLPSNTVNPADGSVASACSWSVSERANKPRYFKEHGFVFGVTVCRPKVYLGNQRSALSGFLSRVNDWMPAVLADNPETSLKKFTSGTTPNGPLGNTLSGDYWIDLRDLFVHGDQFIAGGHAMPNSVALPAADLQRRYAAESEVAELFKTAGAEFLRQDGVVDLAIAGTLVDET